jgi:predicted ester cyclase
VATAVELRDFMQSTFSDVEYELIETVEQGDHAATYVHISATHTGDTFGFPGTGRRFTVEQMHLMRFAADGRIVEHWGVRDDAGMMRQIKPAG